MPDAREVITAIAAIEPATTEPYSHISVQQAEAIARLFNGDDGLFYDLDNAPGRYTSIAPMDDWHWKLRQARNCTAAHFFAILAGRDVNANLCPDCGKPISFQPSGWWTHDGLPGDCWKQSMDGPNE